MSPTTAQFTTPLSTSITQAILDTVLAHIAPHFLAGANDDLPTARDAARNILAAYNVETDAELHLAGDIVSFGFHALEALTEAAGDPSPTKKIRLRGSAVSMSREAHKARRKLDQLQRARQTKSPQPEIQAPAPESPEEKAKNAQALDLIAFAREALEAGTRKSGTPAWTPNRQQRRAAERMTENLKRNQAEQARREARLAAANARTQAAASPPQTPATI